MGVVVVETVVMEAVVGLVELEVAASFSGYRLMKGPGACWGSCFYCVCLPIGPELGRRV